MKTLTFYFDYLSPYAYFAWKKLEEFKTENQLELEIRPVVFGKLLDHWGQLGPAEIPPKRAWLVRYCIYYAKTNNVPLSFPKYHPFNSLPALRASLKSVCGELQVPLISAIFDAGWGRGWDIGDLQVIADIASTVGLDGESIIESTKADAIKNELRANTLEAINQGVFGIPSFVFDNQLFWGGDQFEFMSAVIRGDIDLDEAFIQSVIERPRGIDRKH